MTAPTGKRILFFARHGETHWNKELRWQGRTDIPLSDVGRTQAASLGERTARLAQTGSSIGGIVSSTLVRASETAEIVAEILGVSPVKADPRLQERAFGLFEGLTRADCEARFPRLWAEYVADRRILPPGAEPVDQVIERMRRAVFDAIHNADGNGEAVLFVGHGGAIRSLLTSAFDRPFPPIPNAGLIRVEMQDDRFDDVEYLTDDEAPDTGI